MLRITWIIILIFLSSCNILNKKDNKYEDIVKIPEASGICYMQNSDSFFVANDEWKLFEIDKSGNMLNKRNIWSYDFEWIYCDNDKKEIYLLLENTWNLLIISALDFKIIWDFVLDIDSKKRNKYFNEKSWAEWLIFNSNYFYISTQNNKNNLLKFKISKNNKKLKLEKIYDINYKDLSWLDFYKDLLYILSDKNDSIYVYNLDKEEIDEVIKIKKWSWEWITHDQYWSIYLADDDWKIIKYNY